jgi:hypothetical protein
MKSIWSLLCAPRRVAHTRVAQTSVCQDKSGRVAHTSRRFEAVKKSRKSKN